MNILSSSRFFSMVFDTFLCFLHIICHISLSLSHIVRKEKDNLVAVSFALLPNKKSPRQMTARRTAMGYFSLLRFHFPNHIKHRSIPILHNPNNLVCSLYRFGDSRQLFRRLLQIPDGHWLNLIFLKILP